MSIEMYGWEPTFELLIKACMHEVASNGERGMVTAICHVCSGFLYLETSSTHLDVKRVKISHREPSFEWQAC